MNAYYRDKINGLIMHMAESLVEYYIDYKVYRSIFGVVLEFDRYRITFDNDCKYYQLEFLDDGLKCIERQKFTDHIDLLNCFDGRVFYKIIERRFKGSYWGELAGIDKIYSFMTRPRYREKMETKKKEELKELVHETIHRNCRS